MGEGVRRERPLGSRGPHGGSWHALTEGGEGGSGLPYPRAKPNYLLGLSAYHVTSEPTACASALLPLKIVAYQFGKAFLALLEMQYT